MDLRPITYLLSFVVLLLLFLQFRSCQQMDVTENMIASQKDSLHTYRNKIGEEVASRKALVGTVKDLKNSVLGKDSLIKDLVERVNKQSISLTVLRNQTTTRHSEASTIVSTGDTVVVNDTVYLYPEYSSTHVDKWEKYSILANKDSVILQHTTFNYLAVEQKYVREAWYKPYDVEIQIVNSNPNTITVDAQSFLLKNKKENRLLWLTGTFFAGMVAFSVLNR